jgi:hypothetical protein
MDINVFRNNSIKILVILLAIFITYILYKKYLGRNENNVEGLTQRKWRETMANLKKDVKSENNIDKEEWENNLNLINRDLNLQMLKTLQDLMSEKSINVNGTNYIKLGKYKTLSDTVVGLEDYISNDYVAKEDIIESNKD